MSEPNPESSKKKRILFIVLSITMMLLLLFHLIYRDSILFDFLSSLGFCGLLFINSFNLSEDVHERNLFKILFIVASVFIFILALVNFLSALLG